MGTSIKPQTVNTDTLSAFERFLYVAMPTAFDDSMSLYSCMGKLLAYLKDTVMPALNNNAEGLAEVQNLVNQLEDYVNHYFDNLDVQNEINHKLDEMALDGTLTSLLSPYVEEFMTPIINEQNAKIGAQDDTIAGMDEEIDDFKNDINTAINTIQTEVQSIPGGTPLVVASTDDMTNTGKIYVNTSDGYWYYYNGTAWTQGGVYQATQLADNSVTANKYKGITIVSNNHFDKNTISSGYISSTGVVNDGGTSGAGLNIYSDYIETSGSYVSVSTKHNVIFYDENKDYISGTAAQNAGSTAIPASTKYLRISSVLSDVANTAVSFQSVVAPYDEYSFIINGSKSASDAYFNEGQLLSKNIKGFKSIGKNLFNKYDVVNGVVLKSTTGELIDVNFQSTYSDPFTSDFMEVEPSTTYSRGQYSSNITICFYDEDKAFISGGVNIGFTTPATCKYARITCEMDDIDKIYIIKVIEGIQTTNSPYLYTYDGLRVIKYDRESTMNDPITESEVSWEDFQALKNNNAKIITEYDTYTGKPYITLNKTLGTSAVRNYLYFKTNKKVAEIELEYKSAGNNDNVLGLKFYDKDQTQIYNSLGTASTYPLAKTSWTSAKYRFLIPAETVYLTITIGSFSGASISIRNMNIKLLDRASIGTVNKSFKIHGHQGMTLLAPKNTLPSFEYAVRAGVSDCVINVNWTSDGEIVCLHDDTIDATSSGTGNIHNMTYSTASSYDYGSWFGDYYTGTTIPKLEEVLQLFAKAGVNPIIRWNDGANSTIREKIFSLIEKYGLKDNTTIIGFDLSVLATLKQLHPSYKYGHSGYNSSTDELTQAKCEAIISALGSNAIVDYSGVPSAEIVALAHSNGLTIGCYFINNNSNLRSAFANGVDYVKTDYLALQNCDF